MGKKYEMGENNYILMRLHLLLKLISCSLKSIASLKKLWICLKKSIETSFFLQTSHIISITKVLLAKRKVLGANTNALQYNISI